MNTIVTLRFTSLLYLIALVSGTAIDNGIVGVPSIECESGAIALNVTSRNPFQGRLFVQGLSHEPDCAVQVGGPNTFVRQVQMRIRTDSCNMRRDRSIRPAGMEQSITVIVSFHPVFMTKVDRAFSLRCFYAIAEKAVSSQLAVSMLETIEVTSQTMIMPVCHYSIHAETVDGPAVQYATVGQKLFHVWRCQLPPDRGMLVRNCTITSVDGQRFDALDNAGCPIDVNVIGKLTYNSELIQASVEVHTFKFADRPTLNFQCQIQICNRDLGRPQAPEDDGDEQRSVSVSCEGLSPPQCDSEQFRRRQDAELRKGSAASIGGESNDTRTTPPYRVLADAKSVKQTAADLPPAAINAAYRQEKLSLSSKKEDRRLPWAMFLDLANRVRQLNALRPKRDAEVAEDGGAMGQFESVQSVSDSLFVFDARQLVEGLTHPDSTTKSFTLEENFDIASRRECLHYRIGYFAMAIFTTASLIITSLVIGFLICCLQKQHSKQSKRFGRGGMRR